MIDLVSVSEKAPSGRFLRRLLNLNSHNHNQRGRRRRFYLAVLIEPLTFAPRCDISRLRNVHYTSVRMKFMRALIARDASVRSCWIVVRPLKTACLDTTTDDNQMALHKPPAA